MALVVVELVAVKDWSVVEPTTNSAPCPLIVVVAVAPNEAKIESNTVVEACAILNVVGKESVQVLLVVKS